MTEEQMTAVEQLLADCCGGADNNDSCVCGGWACSHVSDLVGYVRRLEREGRALRLELAGRPSRHVFPVPSGREAVAHG